MLRLLPILLFCAATAAHASDTFTFSNEPGPYAVGLHVRQQYDYARVYRTRLDLVTGQPATGERARPIQTLVWYPAVRGGKPLTFGDYVATAATEDNFALTVSDAQRATDALVAARTRSRPQVKSELAHAMRAVKDAPRQPGRFPVVIYAPSFSAPAAENPDLCEYLASHGYIVIASPSLGARTRFMTSDLEGLETQAADIAYLVAYARTLPQADTDKLAVAGFSWGGLSNVLAAAKDDRIKAVVSLDGSLRGYPEYVNGGKDAPKYVTPARLAVPLLYLAKRPLSVEELNKREIGTTFSLMNRMKYSDVYVVTLHPMKHENFSSWELRFATDGEFDEYTRDEVSLAHGWMARYVLRFLDAYLKDDAAGRAFLDNTAAANGVPRHMVSLDIRHGAGEPPTMETFVGQLAKQGFGRAIDIYQALHAEDASFVIAESGLNTWGYQLLRGGRGKEAIEIFRLGTHLYPTNGNLFDSLAEAYEKAGARDEAILNYRRSLELDPKNSNAVERLKVLGSLPATAPGQHR